MLRRLIFIAYDFNKHMSKKNISAFAASTAFFLFLSLIPMLMLLCSVIPYTPVTEANLLRIVTNIAPDSMDALFTNIIQDVYDKSIGIISVTAIVTLWSAGKGPIRVSMQRARFVFLTQNQKFPATSSPMRLTRHCRKI